MRELRPNSISWPTQLVQAKLCAHASSHNVTSTPLYFFHITRFERRGRMYRQIFRDQLGWSSTSSFVMANTSISYLLLREYECRNNYINKTRQRRRRCGEGHSSKICRMQSSPPRALSCYVQSHLRTSDRTLPLSLISLS